MVNHFMSNSPSYLDAKVNRVKNMSTYTLSTYHPLLRMQISLAMECDGENYNNCKTFFETLNEALFDNSESQIQETNTNKLFNPVLMVMDENGGNWKALREVYGKDFLKRVTLCEFHFKKVSIDIGILDFSLEKRPQFCLSIYDAAVDNIADFITLKKMIKGYENGTFAGRTGPFLKNLQHILFHDKVEAQRRLLTVEIWI